MEAMSYSLPCIAYNICGIKEIIIDNKTELLAKKMIKKCSQKIYVNL